MPLQQGACHDDIYNQDGYCVISQDMQGNIYLMFAQEDGLKVIRQVVGDTFEELWVADDYATF